MTSFKSWLAELDQEIRGGRSLVARKRIEDRLAADRKTGAIPREHLADLAALCRRSGAQPLAIRILHPVIRPKARNPVQPTDQERLEYGASLVQIGAVREGQTILDRLDWRKVPQALLFAAFARFSRWEYAESLPLLERFVKHPSVTDYQLSIGEVNYLAALVADRRFDAAEKVFTRAAGELKRAGHLLLYGNMLGIWAQRCVALGEWAEADRFLDEAVSVQEKVGSVDALYARKWRAVIRLKRRGDAKEGASALDEVRLEAARVRNWETVRDCDFHLAVATRDEKLLERLYFGTPYPAYRRRIERESGVSFGERDSFVRVLKGQRPVVVDTLSAFKAGQVSQRLLALLASDSYKPFRLDALHGELFPDRYYNPATSPVVVHQAVSRLRRRLDREGVPLTVAEHRSEYSLTATGPCALRIRIPAIATALVQEMRADAPVALRLEDYLAKLGKRFGPAREFSRADAAAELGISDRSASRYLAAARDLGLLEQRGATLQARFVIKGR